MTLEGGLMFGTLELTRHPRYWSIAKHRLPIIYVADCTENGSI